MVVMDRVETTTRIEYEASSVVLPDRDVGEGEKLGSDSLLHLAYASQKAVVFEAILRTLYFCKIGGELVSLEKLTRFTLYSSFASLPDYQNKYLSELGVEYSVDGAYELAIPELELRIIVSFEEIDIREGSLFAYIKTRVDVICPKTIVSNVLGGLILTAILAGPVEDAPLDFLFTNEDGSHYICTVNHPVPGNPDEIIADAAKLLSTTDFNDEVHKRDVWKARQTCLTAAGFDPGEIDGINGPNTESASEAYTYYFDGVEVNWSSENFARHIIYHSFVRQKRDAAD